MGPDVLFTYSLVWFPYVFKTLGCHNARDVELRLQKGLRFRFRESHELKVKICDIVLWKTFFDSGHKYCLICALLMSLVNKETL